MDHQLHLTQTQKLFFNTKMIQKLEVLRMNSSEIEEWSQKEYQENPFLEMDEKASKLAKYLSGSIQSSSFQYQQETNWQESEEPILSDYLKEQLGELSLPEEIRHAALWICDALDSDGYLRLDLDTLAHCLNQDCKTAIQALKTVQSLDPSGVAARDLEECLKLQLDRLPEIPQLTYQILNHLNRIATISLPNFAKEINVDIEEIKESLLIIRQLNPKPGSGFSEANSLSKIQITPDYSIENDEHSHWKISLAERTAPILQLSSTYHKLLDEPGEAGAFARARFQRALWVVKSLQQRQETLTKIGEIILKEQILFFNHGKTALRPLTQTALAQEIGVHTSTISRAIAGKWLNSPQGIFPLKYFFTSGRKKQKKAEHLSRSAVKEHLKNLLQKENRQKPLSDEALKKELHKLDICISRRTVTKYREELGHPAAAGRRRNH